MMIYSFLRHYMRPLPAAAVTTAATIILALMVLLGLSQTGVDFRYFKI